MSVVSCHISVPFSVTADFLQIVQRRVNLLEQEGVKFIANVEIGKDVPGHLMVAENDAVLLCTGATRARELAIPGRELDGIHTAMQFLETCQKHQASPESQPDQLSAKDRRVVVIGGGDTATDCIATALRQVHFDSDYVHS